MLCLPVANNRMVRLAITREVACFHFRHEYDRNRLMDAKRSKSNASALEFSHVIDQSVAAFLH